MVKKLKLIEGVLDIVFSTVFFLFILVIFGYSQNDSKSQRVPLNPEFLKCLESKRKGHLKQISEDGKSLGYIPSLTRLPEENVSFKEIFSLTQLQSLPSRFDLWQVERVTIVKNPGSCGSCLAFATMASSKSFLMYKHNQIWDFSEQDLIQYHSFYPFECYGGNHYMSSAQNIWFFPNTKVETIKNAVYQYGAVYLAFKWGSDYYNTSSYSFYHLYAETPNHGIVNFEGDDTFLKERFKVQCDKVYFTNQLFIT